MQTQGLFNPFDTLRGPSSRNECIWTFYRVSSDNLFGIKNIDIANGKMF